MAKIAIMVCNACGAMWYAPLWRGKCPACGHTEGTPKNVEQEELSK